MVKKGDTYSTSKRKGYALEGNVYKKNETVIPLNTDNPHSGHRDRVRERFLKEGLDNFDDHNVLELLLFYSIPQKDTNEIAHNLVNTFGSISGVFDAKLEDLCKVKGITQRTAVLIKMIPQLFKKYETDKLNKDDAVLNTVDLVAEYISKFYKGVTEERLYLLCLDTNCRLLSCNMISTGTVNATQINNRKIIETAYSVNATNIILVHNHPSGIVAPSKKDVDTTIAIANLMSSIGLRLSDHIIIGNGNDYFSFRKSDKWNGIF